MSIRLATSSHAPAFALLLFPLLLAGCRGDQPPESPPLPQSVLESPATVPDAPPASVSLLDLGHVVTPLAAVGGSGVTGEVMTMPSAESFIVSLSAGSLRPGESYMAHIHRGVCAGGGPVSVALEPVVADTDGRGSSTTILEPARVAQAQALFVQLHGADGTPVACGDLPRDRR